MNHNRHTGRVLARLASRRRKAAAVLLLVVAIPAAVALVGLGRNTTVASGTEPGRTVWPEHVTIGRGVMRMDNGVLVYDAPGIHDPCMRPASEVELADTAEVLGVSIGNEHRAYRVEGLSHSPDRHVVNDVIAGKAVSVTYCDLSRCARAFIDDESASPLPIGIAGLETKGQRLVLSIDGKRYLQETGEPLEPNADAKPLPYRSQTLVPTTWGKWRAAHPDSLVYMGG